MWSGLWTPIFASKCLLQRDGTIRNCFRVRQIGDCTGLVDRAAGCCSSMLVDFHKVELEAGLCLPSAFCLCGSVTARNTVFLAASRRCVFLACCRFGCTLAPASHRRYICARNTAHHGWDYGQHGRTSRIQICVASCFFSLTVGFPLAWQTLSAPTRYAASASTADRAKLGSGFQTWVLR